MVDKISVQIQLEGAAQIERELQGVSKAGQQCFADIQKAAEQAGGFAKLDPTIAAQKFKQFGITATAEIDKINAALKTSLNLEAAVLGVTQLEQGFKKTGAAATAAFGLTRREINALRTTLRQIDLGPIGNQIAALGRVGGAFGPAGITIAGLGAALATGGVALVKFAAAAEDTYKALRQLQNASGDSIENLSSMANVFQQGGTPVKEFATAFGNLSLQVRSAAKSMANDVEQSALHIEQAYLSVEQATLGLESAEQNLQKARISGDRSAIAQAELQVRAAVLARAQAEHAARVAEANDLAKNINLYEQMAAGVVVAFNSLTTEATKTQALLAALGKAGGDWKFVLADILKNSTALQRIQIGKQLGLSPEMIATLSVGSAKMREMALQAQRLGIALNDVDKANLEQLIQSQNEAGALFDAIKQKMGALVSPAIASFWEGFTTRLQELIPAFMSIGSAIGQMDFSSLGASAAEFLLTLAKIGAGWAAIISGRVSFSDVLARTLQEAGQVLTSMALAIGIAIGQGIISGIRQSIAAGIGTIWDAIKSGLGIGGPAPAGGGATGGFSHGGLLGGRGTGTSDSNLAWLSRGEHIMPARAVSQPGVLAFLEALRRSGGNLSRVLNGMGRFALGGMVRGPIPAFAAGGLAGGSNVTIQFPGLPAIGGLRASADVVDQLHRAAALAQVRSGGRKPSRYS